MKSLHINYFDKKGGAAIACGRLIESLNKNNTNSELLTNEQYLRKKYKNSKFKQDFSLLNHKLKKYFSIKIKEFLNSENIYRDSINFFNSKIHNYINFHTSDIVNLHWICDEMISIEEIGKINKPLVWTAHDMWPFIGSEHYTSSNYYEKNNKNKSNFLNNWLLNRKKKIFNNKIHIVYVSKWLMEKGKNSKIFSDNPSSYIPNTINTEEWIKLDKSYCKQILNFEKNKKYILFSSFSGIQDYRKGFDLFAKALDKTKLNSKDFCLVVIGNSEGIDKYIDPNEFEYITFNNIFGGNPLPLKIIYSACDFAVVPSRTEAFGQVVIEAGACGLPTVGFSNTGIEDIIDHEKNGLLADNFSHENLAKCINQMLDEDSLKNFSNNIKNKVQNEYDYKIVSEQYKLLYEKIIQENR